MASGAFNLTAQINLQGPKNVGTVVADIKKQLGTINANVNLTIAANAAKNVSQLTTGLQALNQAFKNVQSSATSAASAVAQFNSAVGNIQIKAYQNNLTSATTASQKFSQTQSKTAQSLAASSSEMEEFGRQAGLAVRRFAAFTGVTSIIFGVTNSISKGISAFIDFDKELVKLQQVTGESSSGLSSLQNTITSLSTSLGVGSADLLNVSSTLAQAGLSARDTEKALKALALSSLAPSFDSMNETVEGSIALMRQFGIGAGDLTKALGSVNAVSAKFAVEASDIIAAIQRTGGVFASASKGVSEGTSALNEFIAVFTSVRATTRESAETIATGLRTIFTRIQREGTIDALKEYGVNLTDLNGKFVGAYRAVELLSKGLNSIDPRDLRFSRIVEELGGFRQIGKVIPLIQEFSTAQQALAIAQGGQNSLTADAVKAQLSLANQVSKVREEFLALFREIGASDTFQTIVRGSLQVVSAIIKVADAVKGVLPVLAVLGISKGLDALTKFGSGLYTGVRRGPDNQTSGLAGGGIVQRFAKGGSVPGFGNNDSVPAMLTPGEFVINKSTASKIGKSRLNKINKYGLGGETKATVEELQQQRAGSLIQPDYRSETTIRKWKSGSSLYDQTDGDWTKIRDNNQIGNSRKTAISKMQRQDIAKSKISYTPVPDPSPQEIIKYWGDIDVLPGRKINPKDKRMSNAYEKYLQDKIQNIGARYEGEYDPLDFETGDAKFYSTQAKVEELSPPKVVLSKRLRHSGKKISWKAINGETVELPETTIYHPTNIETNDNLKTQIETFINSDREKTRLAAKAASTQGIGYSYGGEVKYFAKGKKVEFGTGETTFPYRIRKKYAEEKQRSDENMRARLAWDEYPKDERVTVDDSKVREAFQQPFDRTKFVDSFKQKITRNTLFARMADFAKFVGLPQEDLSVALPLQVDFGGQNMSMFTSAQFAKGARGTRPYEGYDLAKFGYGESQKQELYGLEKLIETKQKEIKKITQTPTRTFDDGSFSFDNEAYSKANDELRALKNRSFQLRDLKSEAQKMALSEQEAIASSSGRGTISFAKPLGYSATTQNNVLYHELTHQLFEGLRKKSADSFSKYRERVTSLFSGDNDDLADAFDTLTSDSGYSSADVVYGRSYKLGYLRNMLSSYYRQNSSFDSDRIKEPVPEDITKNLAGLSSQSELAKKAREFRPINPKVNEALIQGKYAVGQDIIDKLEDNGKEEFLTTLIQKAPQLDQNLQAALDSTLTELLSSAGIQRQQYAAGGYVQRFVEGGTAQRKLGYIDYDVIANPDNQDIVKKGMEVTGMTGPRLYADHLTQLAIQARKESNLQKLRAVYGVAGSGKTTLARGQGTDNAKLRQTERFPILSPEDIQKATEVIVLSSSVSKDKLDNVFSATDRTYTLSSTTKEEQEIIGSNRESRDVTRKGLENRKPGSTRSVAKDSAVGEALLSDRLGDRSVVLGRSDSGRFRRKQGDELVEIIKKKIGFTWGGYSPMTAGHESILDAAAAIGIPPEDFIYLVGSNEGITPGKEETYRTAIFDQDTRVLLAKAGAGARGATVLPKPRDFEVPQAFDLSETEQRRRVLVPAKGSTTFVADKTPAETEKYKTAGYKVQHIERTGGISGTMVRQLIQDGNLGELQKVLSPGVYDLISNNIGRIQNRANILPSIIQEVQQIQGTKLADIEKQIKAVGISRIDNKKVASDPEYAAKVEILKELRDKRDQIKSSASFEPHRLLTALAAKEPEKYGLDFSISTTSTKPIRTVSSLQKASIGGLIKAFAEGAEVGETDEMDTFLSPYGRIGVLAKKKLGPQKTILDAIKETAIEQLGAMGSESGVGKLTKIPAGLLRRFRKNLIQDGTLDLIQVSKVLSDALQNKGVEDAAEASRLEAYKAKALHFGIAGLSPLNYKPKEFEWENIDSNGTDVYATARVFDNKYMQAAINMQRKLANAAYESAAEFQDIGIFGDNVPLALDFDDTLISGADILGKDGKPDIPQYEKLDIVKEALKNAKLTRLGLKLKTLIDSNPDFIKQTRILTARPKSNASLLAETLQSFGLPFTSSMITGVGGLGAGNVAKAKATNLAKTEKLIDDNLQNISAVKESGKMGFQYSELKQGSTELDELMGQGNLEGAATEKALAILGAPIKADAKPNRAIDYPMGLGPAAQYFTGLPSDIPTEVKRTIDGSSLDKARKEIVRYITEGQDAEKPQGFAIGGKISRRVPYEKDVAPSPFEIPKTNIDYYSLEQSSGFKGREFDALVQYAKTNDLSLAEFQKYLSTRLDQKRQKSGMVMDPTSLQQFLLHGTRTPDITDRQRQLAESLKGPVDAKYNPKYDNAIGYAGGGAVSLYHGSNTGVNDSVLESFKREGAKSDIAQGYGQGAGFYVYSGKQKAKDQAIMRVKKGLGSFAVVSGDTEGKPMVLTFREVLDPATWDLDYELTKGPVVEWLVKNYDKIKDRVVPKITASEQLTGIMGVVAKDTTQGIMSAGVRVQSDTGSRKTIYSGTDSDLREGQLIGQIMNRLQSQDPEMVYDFENQFFNSPALASGAWDNLAIKYVGSKPLRPVDIEVFSGGGDISKFDGGGYVPAMVSNGEAFVPPEIAKRIGYDKLNKMNQADKLGGLKSFSTGGISVFKGPGSGTSDSIGPIPLPVGSFVIREAATKALGLHTGGTVGIQSFAGGSPGGVGTSTVRIVEKKAQVEQQSVALESLKQQRNDATGAARILLEAKIKDVQDTLERLNGEITSATDEFDTLSKTINKASRIQKIAQDGLNGAQSDLVNKLKGFKFGGLSFDKLTEAQQQKAIEKARKGDYKDSSGKDIFESENQNISEAQTRLNDATDIKTNAQNKRSAKFGTAKSADDVRNTALTRQETQERKVQDEQFFEYKGKKEGTTGAAYKYSLARKLGQTAYSLSDQEQYEGSKQELVYGLSTKRSEMTSLGQNLRQAEKDAQADPTDTAAQTRLSTLQSRLDQEVEAIAKSMRDLNPTLENVDQNARAVAEAMAAGDMQAAQKKMQESLGKVPTAAEATSIAFQRMADELGQDVGILERQFGSGSGLKMLEQQKFIASKEGQRFGVAAEFAPDLAKWFSGTKAGKVGGDVSDFLTGKGGRYSQMLGRVGGVTTLAAGISAAPGLVQKALGDPTSAQGAAQYAGAQGAASVAGAGLQLASSSGPLAPFVLAGTAVAALATAFKDGRNAFIEFEKNLRSQNIQRALESTASAFEALARDAKDEAAQQQIADKLVSAGNEAAASTKLDDIPKAFYVNLFDSMMGGKDAASRSRVLEKEGTMAYLSTTQIGTMGGLFGNADENRRAYAREAMPERAASNAKQYSEIASQTRQLMEAKGRAGQTSADIKASPEYANLAKNLALANAAVQEQILAIDNSTAYRTDADREAAKEAIIRAHADKELSSIMSATDRAKAAAELEKTARSFSMSFKRLFDNMEAAIARSNAELSKFNNALDASVSAMSGNARNSSTQFDTLDVLKNPKAYSQDRVDAANNQAGKMFGFDANIVSGLSGLGDKLETSLMKSINNTLTNNAGASDTKVMMDLEKAIGGEIEGLSLPKDLSAQLGKEIAVAVGDMRKDGTKKIDIDQLMDKIPALKTSIESAKNAQNASIAALQNWQNSLNSYSDALNKAADMEMQAAEQRRKASDIAIEGAMNLGQALGKDFGADIGTKLRDQKVAGMTGGLTSPTDIRNRMEELNDQRRRQQAEVDLSKQQSVGGSKTAIQNAMNNEKLLKQTNNQLRQTSAALKHLAESGSAASSALNAIQDAQRKQQGKVGLIEKLVTSGPEELFNFNKSLNSLNRMSAGQTVQQTPEERRDTLSTLNDIAPLLGSGQQANNIKANVLESMLRDSGIGVSTQFKEILDALRNPESDSETQQAIKTYQAAIEVQSQANEALAQINENLASNIANETAEAIKNALSGITVNFNQTQLDDIAKGVRAPSTVAPDRKALGGLIYAAAGTMVDFQPRGTDTVPAMLTPGEFVVNKTATANNLGLLHSINSGKTKYYADGGYVSNILKPEFRTSTDPAGNIVQATKHTYPDISDIDPSKTKSITAYSNMQVLPSYGSPGQTIQLAALSSAPPVPPGAKTKDRDASSKWFAYTQGLEASFSEAPSYMLGYNHPLAMQATLLNTPGVSLSRLLTLGLIPKIIQSVSSSSPPIISQNYGSYLDVDSINMDKINKKIAIEGNEKFEEFKSKALALEGITNLDLDIGNESFSLNGNTVLLNIPNNISQFARNTKPPKIRVTKGGMQPDFLINNMSSVIDKSVGPFIGNELVKDEALKNDLTDYTISGLAWQSITAQRTGPKESSISTSFGGSQPEIINPAKSASAIEYLNRLQIATKIIKEAISNIKGDSPLNDTEQTTKFKETSAKLAQIYNGLIVSLPFKKEEVGLDLNPFTKSDTLSIYSTSTESWKNQYQKNIEDQIKSNKKFDKLEYYGKDGKYDPVTIMPEDGGSTKNFPWIGGSDFKFTEDIGEILQKEVEINQRKAEGVISTTPVAKYKLPPITGSKLELPYNISYKKIRDISYDPATTAPSREYIYVVNRVQDSLDIFRGLPSNLFLYEDEKNRNPIGQVQEIIGQISADKEIEDYFKASKADEAAYRDAQDNLFTKQVTITGAFLSDDMKSYRGASAATAIDSIQMPIGKYLIDAVDKIRGDKIKDLKDKAKSKMAKDKDEMVSLTDKQYSGASLALILGAQELFSAGAPFELPDLLGDGWFHPTLGNEYKSIYDVDLGTLRLYMGKLSQVFDNRAVRLNQLVKRVPDTYRDRVVATLSNLYGATKAFKAISEGDTGSFSGVFGKDDFKDQTPNGDPAMNRKAKELIQSLGMGVRLAGVGNEQFTKDQQRQREQDLEGVKVNNAKGSSNEVKDISAETMPKNYMDLFNLAINPYNEFPNRAKRKDLIQEFISAVPTARDPGTNTLLFGPQTGAMFSEALTKLRDWYGGEPGAAPGAGGWLGTDFLTETGTPDTTDQFSNEPKSYQKKFEELQAAKNDALYQDASAGYKHIGGKEKFNSDLPDLDYYERVQYRRTGGMIYASQGQLVNFQPQGTDTVPAMLTPGEFVVNARATAQHLPLLQAINNGETKGFNKGGVVYLQSGGQPSVKERREARAQAQEQRQEQLRQMKQQRQAFMSARREGFRIRERALKEGYSVGQANMMAQQGTMDSFRANMEAIADTSVDGVNYDPNLDGRITDSERNSADIARGLKSLSAQDRRTLGAISDPDKKEEMAKKLMSRDMYALRERAVTQINNKRYQTLQNKIKSQGEDSLSPQDAVFLAKHEARIKSADERTQTQLAMLSKAQDLGRHIGKNAKAYVAQAGSVAMSLLDKALGKTAPTTATAKTDADTTKQADNATSSRVETRTNATQPVPTTSPIPAPTPPNKEAEAKKEEQEASLPPVKAPETPEEKEQRRKEWRERRNATIDAKDASKIQQLRDAGVDEDTIKLLTTDRSGDRKYLSGSVKDTLKWYKDFQPSISTHPLTIQQNKINDIEYEIKKLQSEQKPGGFLGFGKVDHSTKIAELQTLAYEERNKLASMSEPQKTLSPEEKAIAERTRAEIDAARAKNSKDERTWSERNLGLNLGAGYQAMGEQVAGAVAGVEMGVDTVRGYVDPTYKPDANRTAVNTALANKAAQNVGQGVEFARNEVPGAASVIDAVEGSSKVAVGATRMAGAGIGAGIGATSNALGYTTFGNTLLEASQNEMARGFVGLSTGVGELGKAVIDFNGNVVSSVTGGRYGGRNLGTQMLGDAVNTGNQLMDQLYEQKIEHARKAGGDTTAMMVMGADAIAAGAADIALGDVALGAGVKAATKTAKAASSTTAKLATRAFVKPGSMPGVRRLTALGESAVGATDMAQKGVAKVKKTGKAVIDEFKKDADFSLFTPKGLRQAGSEISSDLGELGSGFGQMFDEMGDMFIPGRAARKEAAQTADKARRLRKAEMAVERGRAADLKAQTEDLRRTFGFDTRTGQRVGRREEIAKANRKAGLARQQELTDLGYRETGTVQLMRAQRRAAERGVDARVVSDAFTGPKVKVSARQQQQVNDLVSTGRYSQTTAFMDPSVGPVEIIPGKFRGSDRITGKGKGSFSRLDDAQEGVRLAKEQAEQTASLKRSMDLDPVTGKRVPKTKPDVTPDIPKQSVPTKRIFKDRLKTTAGYFVDKAKGLYDLSTTPIPYTGPSTYDMVKGAVDFGRSTTTAIAKKAGDTYGAVKQSISNAREAAQARKAEKAAARAADIAKKNKQQAIATAGKTVTPSVAPDFSLSGVSEAADAKAIAENLRLAQDRAADIVSRYASSEDNARRALLDKDKLVRIDQVVVDPSMSSRTNAITGKQGGVGASYQRNLGGRTVSFPTTKNAQAQGLALHEVLHGVQDNLGHLNQATKRTSLSDLTPQMEEFLKPGGAYDRLIEETGGSVGGAGFYPGQGILKNHHELFTSLGQAEGTSAFRNNLEAQDMLRSIVKAYGYSNGGIIYANNGALIAAQQNTDSVPAMLTPGEFVVNREAAQRFMPTLTAINSGHFANGGRIQYLANGGVVQPKYLASGNMVDNIANMSSQSGVLNNTASSVAMQKPAWVDDFISRLDQSGAVFNQGASKVVEGANIISSAGQDIKTANPQLTVGGNVNLANADDIIRKSLNGMMPIAQNAGDAARQASAQDMQKQWNQKTDYA